MCGEEEEEGDAEKDTESLGGRDAETGSGCLENELGGRTSEDDVTWSCDCRRFSCA